MIFPKTPSNERDRLEKLRSYEILDTAGEQEFDDLTMIASEICGTPISLISLVDQERQWFKSKVGLNATETPRNISFCGHAINEPNTIFEINDAHKDERFHDSPLVTGNPKIRFYAGVPLVTDEGEALGTLCVIDQKPKVLNDSQRRTLEALSRQVLSQLELKKRNLELTKLLKEGQKLKTQFKLLSLVASKSENLVIITDEKYRIIYANDSFIDISGYSLTKIKRKTPVDLFLGENANPIHAQRLKQKLQEQEPFSVELPCKTKTGEIRWISYHVSLIYNEEKEIENYIAVGLDITNEYIQRSTLQNLSLVASKTHNAVVITNEKGEVEYVNEAFISLTGYSFEEVAGKKPGSMLQGPDTKEEHKEAMRRGIASRKPFTQEILNYTKNGEAYWLSCSISPVLNHKGELLKFIAIEQDVTIDKKNKELLIQAKEEAIMGEKVKDQFLSNMSHEIRTPMNGIIGITNILLNESDLSTKNLELVQHVNGAANHLLTIINDILDLSKINAEKLTFEQINFDLHKIFEAMHYSLGLKAEEKGIDFVSDIDPKVPVIVSGDPVRFNQILLNLASNAIKFTERGTVSIKVNLLETNAKGPRLLFKVQDTGIGIAREHIGKVFNQFNQSNITITRKFGGTGLGLSISKKLIEMHDGKVTVESELGKGTTFIFDLQLFSQIDEHQSNGEDSFIDMSAEEKATVKILLAEDNKLNQIVATRHVKGFGFNIDVVENGQEAIDRLRIQDYDLVLMDVNMPVMNGLDATRFIRSNLKEKKGLKVAAMTASVLNKDISLCYDAGMDDFISKPFVPEELYQKIINLVRSN